MRINDKNFCFDPNFNFATDSLFTIKNPEEGAPFPPTPGFMELLDGTAMLLLDGTDMLYL